MNIFVLHSSPYEIARHYCNIHLNKMMVEHVQLLCSAMPEQLAPYKRTHYNHPCSKWVRESANNWNWLLQLTWSMGQEYINRFSRRHKSCEVREQISNWDVYNYLPSNGRTPWSMVMPDEYKSDDCIASYRKYYAHKLKDFRSRGICSFGLTNRRKLCK